MDINMSQMRHFSRFARPALLLLVAGLLLNSAPIALAQYVPPDRGLPGRREGGGTRGGCLLNQPSLTALMPKTNFGYTVQAQPTFLWFVPESTATTAEFILWDEDDSEIYRTMIQLPTTAGIVRVSLPTDDSAPTLETGKDYRWSFAIVCDPEDRSGDLLTEGWVQRKDLDSQLENRLAQATPLDRATLYARAGVWYEAISTLADLRQAQPNSSTVTNRWRTLLNSVELGEFANQPILESPETKPILESPETTP